MLMHCGFTPAEIDAMPIEDVRLFILGVPTVRELMSHV